MQCPYSVWECLSERQWMGHEWCTEVRTQTRFPEIDTTLLQAYLLPKSALPLSPLLSYVTQASKQASLAHWCCKMWSCFNNKSSAYLNTWMPVCLTDVLWHSNSSTQLVLIWLHSGKYNKTNLLAHIHCVCDRANTRFWNILSNALLEQSVMFND